MGRKTKYKSIDPFNKNCIYRRDLTENDEKRNLPYDKNQPEKLSYKQRRRDIYQNNMGRKTKYKSIDPFNKNCIYRRDLTENDEKRNLPYDKNQPEKLSYKQRRIQYGKNRIAKNRNYSNNRKKNNKNSYRNKDRRTVGPSNAEQSRSKHINHSAPPSNKNIRMEGIRKEESYREFSRRLGKQTRSALQKTDDENKRLSKKRKRFLNNKKYKKHTKTANNYNEYTGDFDDLKDEVRFGEFAQQPPKLRIVPKRKEYTPSYNWSDDSEEFSEEELDTKTELNLLAYQIRERYKEAKRMKRQKAIDRLTNAD
eukprot:TRINITY_DN1049_c0_g1_i1.p1 TRINITY_DN1049_c0_g1~~TRINITY_DN1049_c0_g1_i1.p1  ORF type:complete len:324 (+),score=59.08 TRINITY_DN1049_c0_g1_i1:44-973(+)